MNFSQRFYLFTHLWCLLGDFSVAFFKFRQRCGSTTTDWGRLWVKKQFWSVRSRPSHRPCPSGNSRSKTFSIRSNIASMCTKTEGICSLWVCESRMWHRMTLDSTRVMLATALVWTRKRWPYMVRYWVFINWNGKLLL